MLKIKTSQFRQQPPDFSDVGMRRLMGALEEQKRNVADAMQRLEQYISSGQVQMGLAEIKADHELSYSLYNVFGNDWEKLVTGNII